MTCATCSAATTLTFHHCLSIPGPLMNPVPLNPLSLLTCLSCPLVWKNPTIISFQTELWNLPWLLWQLVALPLVLPQHLVPVSGMSHPVLNFNFSSHFYFCQTWAWRGIISHLFLYLEHLAYLLAHSRNSGDVWWMNALNINTSQVTGKGQVAVFC